MRTKEVIELGGMIFERSDVLADRLGVTLDALWRMHRNDKIPRPLKIGKSSFYPSAEVDSRLLASVSDGE